MIPAFPLDLTEPPPLLAGQIDRSLAAHEAWANLARQGPESAALEESLALMAAGAQTLLATDPPLPMRALALRAHAFVATHPLVPAPLLAAYVAEEASGIWVRAERSSDVTEWRYGALPGDFRGIFARPSAPGDRSWPSPPGHGHLPVLAMLNPQARLLQPSWSVEGRMRLGTPPASIAEPMVGPSGDVWSPLPRPRAGEVVSPTSEQATAHLLAYCLNPGTGSDETLDALAEGRRGLLSPRFFHLGRDLVEAVWEWAATEVPAMHPWHEPDEALWSRPASDVGSQVLAALAVHPAASVRRVAARHLCDACCDGDQGLAAVLCTDRDASVRGLCARWSREPAVIAGFAGDPSPLVRASLVDNRHITEPLIAQLSEDPTERVRRAVMRRLGRALSAL